MSGVRLLSFAVACLGLVGGGCGGDEHPLQSDAAPQADAAPDGEPQGQVPSYPVGSIIGIVTTAETGAALADVKVWVPSTDESGAIQVVSMTDATGAYALNGLPAGATYTVHFELDGFVSRLIAANLPNAVGLFPQGNAVAEVDTTLATASATITGKILVHDGAGGAGAVVGFDLRDSGYDLVGEASADAQGTYTLSGLPGTPTGLVVKLTVAPYDADADGFVDYDTLTLSANTFPDTVTHKDLDLRPTTAAVTLVSSDVDDGVHPPTAAINLVFNRRIAPGHLSVALRDTDAARDVAATASLDAAATTVTVRPAGGAQLGEGTMYSLTLIVEATNGAAGTFIRPFQAVSGTPGILPAVTGLAIEPENADYNTTGITLSFAPVVGAQSYQVLARDNLANPAWLHIGSVGSSPAPHVTLSLPAIFDVFSADGVQTPFAYHTRVDFLVLPVDVYGVESSLDTATVVSRTDTVEPTVTSAVQHGSADNSGGATPATIDLTVQFSEFLDPTASILALTLPHAGMSATFDLDPGFKGGTFTITIPAGLDGSGDYTLSGAVDTSGNAMDAYHESLKKVVELVVNGGFEGAPCTLTGWQTSTTSTASVPAAVSSPTAFGSCAVRVGNATALDQYGYSRLYQDIVLPAGATNITVSLSHRLFSTYVAPGYDYSACALTTTGGSTLLSLFNTYANASTFTAVTANATSLAGQTVRFMCYSYQYGYDVSGGYLDGISVLVSP